MSESSGAGRRSAADARSRRRVIGTSIAGVVVLAAATAVLVLQPAPPAPPPLLLDPIDPTSPPQQVTDVVAPLAGRVVGLDGVTGPRGPGFGYRVGAVGTVGVSWAAVGSTLVVETMGSGSCPLVVDDIRGAAGDQQTVVLHLVDTAAGPPRSTPPGIDPDLGRGRSAGRCTADARTLVMAVEPPPGITPSRPLRVVIGTTAAVLPPR